MAELHRRLDSDFAAVASTLPCPGSPLVPELDIPLLEDRHASPLARLDAVVSHADLTPQIFAAAQRVSDMEFEAQENNRIGDAVFAQESKNIMLEILSALHERKKVRVHAAAADAVQALETKVLRKAARKARKALKRATPAPEALRPRKKNNFGYIV